MERHTARRVMLRNCSAANPYVSAHLRYVSLLPADMLIINNRQNVPSDYLMYAPFSLREDGLLAG